MFVFNRRAKVQLFFQQKKKFPHFVEKKLPSGSFRPEK